MAAARSPTVQYKSVESAGNMSETDKSKKSPSIDRYDILVMAVLVAVVLFYFRHLLWTDKYIYGELDIRRHFYFFKKFSYELMQGGELPLWIPHLYCGMPLLAASQVTPFYLPDLVFMLARIPLNMAFNWDLLAHLIAAQIFSYLFFRRLFGRRIVAAFCSLWFWNFFFLNSISTGDALNIRAMLLVPVLFYFTEASLGEEGRPSYFLFGALALSMHILCGGLQFTFYAMAAVTIYGAFLLMLRARRKERVLYPILGFSALIAVGMAIAAAQWVPAWEYGHLSVRGTGVSWFKIWALKPYQLIDYILPEFEGKGTAHGYFGIVAFVLAAYSLPFWKAPRKYFFVALGIVSIVYSFGGNTLISTYLAGLPLVRDFRGPFRAAILFNLSVFILAGGALVSLLKTSDVNMRKRQVHIFAIIAVALAAGFGCVVLFSRDYAGFSIAGAAGSAVLMVLSILAVLALVLSDRLKNHAAIALLVLLVIDLACRYGNFYAPTTVSEVFEKDAFVDFLEEKKSNDFSRIVVHNTAHSNYFGLFGFESANGHHPFPTTRSAMFLPLLNAPHVASLAGVKYKVSYGFDKDGRPYNPPTKGTQEVSIEELSMAPLPRAFLVHDYQVLPLEEVPDAMKHWRFDPRQTVILEESPGGIEPAAGFLASGSATVVSRKANKVSIMTESEREAILVLTESYYPGWQAEIDGKRAPILKADYVFRAVSLSPGAHTVVFKFRPATFLIGSALSCAGIIAWLAWALFLWKAGKL